MRESCTYGSVRGAPSNGRPYRDRRVERPAHAADCYISRVENGKYEVKRRIPKEELLKNMPLRHNLSTLPV